MNLLFFCNSRYWGGGEKYVVDVAAGLTARDHVCRIVANSGSPLHREAATHSELEILTFDLGPKLSKGSALEFATLWSAHARRLRRFLEECLTRFPIDLVHFQYKKEQLLGTKVAHGMGLPVVWTEHDRLPPSFTAPIFPVVLYRRAARLPRRIVCVSRFGARDLERRGISPDLIDVCYNGIEMQPTPTASDRAAARQGLGMEAEAVVIGTTPRLLRNKGHRFLLDAVPVLRERIPQLHVLIMGDGPARQELERQAQQLKIDQCITFTGHLRDVRPMLAALDVFVLPSLREGMPFSVLEAMGAGLPVVATTVGGVPEVVDEGETGLLVPPRNASALTQATLALLNDADRRTRMGAAALRKVHSQFTMDRMIENTEKALLAAIGNPAASTTAG